MLLYLSIYCPWCAMLVVFNVLHLNVLHLLDECVAFVRSLCWGRI